VFRLPDAPTGDVALRVERDGATATLPLRLAPGDERLTLVVDLRGE
jgi:hypothetical protein